MAEQAGAAARASPTASIATAVTLAVTPAVRGPHRVVPVMGTVISIDVRDPGIPESVVDAMLVRLEEIEARFSTYRPGSEISRIARGELAEAHASAEVRFVLGMCDDLYRTTDGWFDARGHRADGRLDPSGLVKGWAVEEAALLLDEAGARNYSCNCGGDVIARGEPEPGRPWRVGIRHPDRADAVARVLAVRDLAVATSGTYERGEHIRDPRTGLAPTGLLSVTVVGPSLTWADVYATTAFAMGEAGPAWVATHPGYGALAITADRRLAWTPLVEPLLA
jgi:thiamine biosynthesis lipoprotein